MNAPNHHHTPHHRRRRCRGGRGIKGVAIRTPLVNSPALDERLGARVFLKAETLQRTGSFKFRGAYNKISQIQTQRESGRRGRLFVRQSRALCEERGATLVPPFDDLMPTRNRSRRRTPPVPWRSSVAETEGDRSAVSRAMALAPVRRFNSRN